MSRELDSRLRGNDKKHKTVFVGMSGGVDSSVAALLLKRQGYDVVGVFMRCYNVDGCAEKDAEDARRVAEHLKIPFYVWDFEKEYKERVVKYMIEGYRKGITPNPDVECNREIKFGLFLKRALEMGADYVATGHYVRLHSSANSESSTNKRIKKNMSHSVSFVNSKQIRYSLIVAQDAQKDQSYFLWTLRQEQLKHSLFPIGDYLKPQVRVIAKKAGLTTAEKKDSQGICFLGAVNIKDFLKKYIPEKKGDILDSKGRKIGEHKGAHFYTVGQRHLGTGYRLEVIGDSKNKNRKPLYIVKKDARKNILVVSEQNGDMLLKKEIKLANVNWINSITYNRSPLTCLVRIRYRQPLVHATLYLKLKTKNLKLIFDTPQKFIASGQSAVFYTKKGELLGGGIIV